MASDRILLIDLENIGGSKARPAMMASKLDELIAEVGPGHSGAGSLRGFADHARGCRDPGRPER